jgi:hypothetical protein
MTQKRPMAQGRYTLIVFILHAHKALTEHRTALIVS